MARRLVMATRDGGVALTSRRPSPIIPPHGGGVPQSPVAGATITRFTHLFRPALSVGPVAE